MVLLDVNVLVYAHREDSPRHIEYLRWLVKISSTLIMSTACPILS